jgi:NAD-dependent SIR2 family protein deacetylase
MSPLPDLLRTFIDKARSIVVLSGAGVSTGSGIPDYRDRNGDWKHSQPIQFGDFMKNAKSRRRYWSRSYIGWQRFSGAEPNATHRALARLEESGKVDTVITQNVDRLHSRAGSQRVIDLHGDLSKVRCMGCDEVTERRAFQGALEQHNPGWTASARQYRADGDAELIENADADFNVPECSACGGIVKPDVVMFGENVPRGRVKTAMDAVERADALLVVGSSLMVFSGYRFARHANELGKPLAIVNHGRTRADEMAEFKIEEDCASVLPAAIDAVLN